MEALRRRYWVAPTVLTLVVFGALVIAARAVFSSPSPQLDCEGDAFEVGSGVLADWPNTDFCTFKYPSGQFLSGGVPRDGIPPLYPDGYRYPERIPHYGGEEPAFTVEYESIASAEEWLEDQSPVLVVEVNGDARAYPLGILTRHEIANTFIGDTPVAVTFCPLCNTGIVFDRRVEGQEYHFGVSGFLRNSDLVMWDHETESWWQQATGEAVVGAMTGQQLTFLTSSMVSWADFKAQYPDGQALSAQGRNYDFNPYAGYDSSSRPFLYNGYFDERLPAMERVLGYATGEGETAVAVAYPFSALSERIVVHDEVAGQPVVVFWQPGAVSALDGSTISESREVGSAAIFSPVLPDGRRLTFAVEGMAIRDEQTGSVWNIFGRATEGELAGTQLAQQVAVTHFWFAWVAFHPDTVLWGIENGEQ